MTRDDVAIPPKSDQRGSSLEEVREPRNHREAHLRMRHSGDRLLESAISGFVAMSMRSAIMLSLRARVTSLRFHPSYWPHCLHCSFWFGSL